MLQAFTSEAELLFPVPIALKIPFTPFMADDFLPENSKELLPDGSWIKTKKLRNFSLRTPFLPHSTDNVIPPGLRCCQLIALLEKPLRPFAIVPTALVCDPTIKLTAIRVYAVLVSHKKPDNTAWCALDRITEALGIDKPAACKGIRELQKAGYIIKIAKGGGQRKVSRYIIKPPDQIVLGDNQTDLEDATVEKKFADLVVSGDKNKVSHETPKYTGGDYLPPFPPLAGGESVGANAPSQEFVGASGEAIMDGPSGPALGQSGSPSGDRFCPDTAIAELKKLSATGARVKNFDDAGDSVAVSKGYAVKKLLTYYGDDDRALAIVDAAENPDHPEHHEAVQACTFAAKKLAIFWSPPKKKRKAS